MTQELFSLHVGDRVRASDCLFEEIPIGPGHWLSRTRPAGPPLYAVPGDAGGYEWVSWEEAAERGWSDRHGAREYQGTELERRFLVLYFPAARRGWPAFWRQVAPPPMRLEVYRSQGEAERLAGRLVPRRQLGFHWTAEPNIRAVWGWDDREIGYHEDCDDECGCTRPAPGREFVLIVEFAREDLAVRPDVRLERRAWMARLDAERATAITAHCDGQCRPECAHCSASDEEIDAAWSWLSTHRREGRAWRRRQRRQARRRHPWTMSGPAIVLNQPGGGVVQTAPPPQRRNPQ
jgi:hypothetical protein